MEKELKADENCEGSWQNVCSSRKKNLKTELKRWLIIRNVKKDHKMYSIKREIFGLFDIPLSLWVGNACLRIDIRM